MSKKKMAIANFNVVFYGDNGRENALLDYFDSIFYPAFTSEKIRKTDDAEYLIMDAEVIEDKEGDLVFKGKLVKKTILEVKSDIDESGNLVEKDDRYSTAPYSMFAIYMENHRMIYVQNQKGSPSLASFSAMTKFLLSDYMRKLKEVNKEQGLPEPPAYALNVVGIPRREDLESILKSVHKVNCLTLKFMPLNGDGDIGFGEMFNQVTKELRQSVGSEKGQIVLPSPQNYKGIIDVIDQAQGTVEPVFHVTLPDKSKKTIKNDIISERMEIDILGDNIQDYELDIINKGKENKSIAYVSEDNKKKYEACKGKIIQLVRK